MAEMSVVTIRVPYFTNGQYKYLPLLDFFYAGDFPGLEQTEIRGILAVELRVFDESAAATKSLFLTTTEVGSFIKFERFRKSDETAGRQPWLMDFGDGNLFKFKPELNLEVYIRCPLMPYQAKTKTDCEINDSDLAEEPRVNLRFSFGDDKSQANLNKWEKLKNNSGFSTFDWERKPDKPVDYVFTTLRGKRDTLDIQFSDEKRDRTYEWNPPRLLAWKDFCTGRPPHGHHHWEMRLAPLPGQSQRYGIELSYYCQAHSGFESGAGLNFKYEGWGQTARTAARLWPFGIAPRKNYLSPVLSTDPDSYARLTLTQTSSQAGTLRWLLRCALVYDNASATLDPLAPLGAWNEALAAGYFNPLRTMKGGSPESVIPFFTGTPEEKGQPRPQRWEMSYELEDHRPHAPHTADMIARLPQADFDIRFLSLRLLSGPLAVEGELKNFRDHAGAPIRRRFTLASAEPPAAEPPAPTCGQESGARPWPHFRFELTDEPGAPRQRARVGALDLHFGSDSHQPDHRAPGVIDVTLSGLGDLNETGRAWQLKLEAELFYNLEAFAPGGQDPTPLEINFSAERRANSLIVPFADRTEDQGDPDNPHIIGGAFMLVAREQNSGEFTHRLSLRLERIKVGSEQQAESRLSFIIIEQQPFLLARVTAEMGFGGEIGNWSGAAVEGASWELFDKGTGFQLILPPQAIGEEFIKRYSLTLPAALNYKFSPPAVFHLSRSAFDQQFTEAPWNLRRLLGYPGQRAPGMGIGALEFELLYGLTAKITGELLRLTELDARLGRLPDGLPEEAPLQLQRDPGARPNNDDALGLGRAYLAYRREYQKQLDLLRARLALLQPWTPAQSGPGLILDEGVDYRLRGTRRAADPITPNQPTDVFFKFRRSPQGLQGGVDWGFESRNIHNELLRNPFSTSGRIINPSFTALGGSGFQKAGFAQDKTTIYADTFLGRAFFYSLQRIGRIGMLWNTAKHVITYERSVVASEQFSENSAGWQGRPVVRKMREYVELLQPERHYPEFGEAPRVRGFVLAAKFGQTIIPIDSQWGQDVPGGWTAPLYMPGANPAAYREPDVFLKMATPEEKGHEHGWARITNPEILRFYTSTKDSDGVNTDLWEAVPGVDFPVEPLPTAPADIPKPTDAQLPDPPGLHPGYERFTFRLAAAEKTRLLHGRAEAATEALIENVSLIRRSLSGVAVELTGANRKLTAAADESVKFRIQLEKHARDLVAKIETGDPASVFPEFAQQVKDKTSEMAQLYRNVAGQGADTIDWLGGLQQAATSRWAQGWAAAQNGFEAKLREKLQVAAAAQAADVLEVVTEVARQLQAAEVALDEAQRKINGAVVEFRAAYGELVKALAEIEEELTVALATQELESYPALALAAVNRLQRLYAQHKLQLGGSYPTLLADFAFRLTQALQRELADEAGVITGLLPDPPDWDDEEAVAAWLELVDVGESLALLRLSYDQALARIEGHAGQLNDRLNTLRDRLKDRLEQTVLGDEFVVTILAMARDPQGGLAAAVKYFRDRLGVFGAEFKTIYEQDALNYLREQAEIVHEAFGQLREAAAPVLAQLEGAKRLVDKLKGLAPRLDEAAAKAYRELVATAPAALMHGIPSVEKLIKDEAQRLAQELFGSQIGELRDRTLRLVRAFGAAPVAEAMKLNRDRLAYYFQELKEGQFGLKDVIDFTPASVLVNRVGREIEQFDLKSMGIRLPSISLGEKFLPTDFKKLFPLPKLRDILPNIAGLDLARLFEGVEFPRTSSDAVRITHGINPTTLQAWAQCDVDLPLGGERALFSLGLVKVTLARCRLTAKSFIALNAQGAPQRTVDARIKGDWALIVGGEMVLTIKDATLQFDNSGRLSFKMQPQSIVLNKALEFLTDLMRALKPSGGSGLSFKLIFAGAFPVGVRAQLNLALPPIQTGAFAISNLALAAHFEVAAPGGDFYLGAGCGIASKERPFNLSILCLGGGGWFTVQARYYPFRSSNRLQAFLSVGIAAGASLVFDIGVASGGIYFLLSVGVEYVYGGGGGQLTILLRIAVSGELVVLGFISVSILIALEARYVSGGALVCRGTLSLKIEIGWFFEIEIDQEVTFTFGGGGGGGGSGLAAFRTGAALAEAGTASLAVGAQDTVDYSIDHYLASFGT
ncbi:MAG TPA: hypothetical protein VJ810_10165 [Blastocatellia bacterium]|nr:hypothetical protein [Blastocatellia bacterium]